MRKEAFITARALPSRSRDLTLSGQNDSKLRGGDIPPLSFRLLSRCSGRFPALPYPPLR